MSPTARITVSIVGLTLSLLLVADFAGIIKDYDREMLKQRQRLSEMVSLQLSIAVRGGSRDSMHSLLWSAVERNEDVLGAAYRRRDGVLLARFGDFPAEIEPGLENSETYMRLPVMSGEKHFGQLELMFKPLEGGGPFGLSISTIVMLVVIISSLGSLGYWFFIRRSLLYLDPSSAIPERVYSALNVLTNGVLILDEKGRIVLANGSFAGKFGVAAEQLIGRRPEEFPWRSTDVDLDKRQLPVYPWQKTLRHGKEMTEVVLHLDIESSKPITFKVSSSPILDGDNKQRGVIVGFDDVTTLQNTNSRLNVMLKELEAKKQEIENKNKELHIMASSDALTGCQNRRSMYECADPALLQASRDGIEFTCIMLDIDHFKSVNDNYGHSVGDDVIKMVAGILLEQFAEDYIVCRYGGEEFCVLMHGVGIFEAKRYAERCRQQIEATETCGISVTSSFGISNLKYGARNVDELINQADEALYASKNKGRNCVSCWEKGSTLSVVEGGGQAS